MSHPKHIRQALQSRVPHCTTYTQGYPTVQHTLKGTPLYNIHSRVPHCTTYTQGYPTVQHTLKGTPLYNIHLRVPHCTTYTQGYPTVQHTLKGTPLYNIHSRVPHCTTYTQGYPTSDSINSPQQQLGNTVFSQHTACFLSHLSLLFLNSKISKVQNVGISLN